MKGTKKLKLQYKLKDDAEVLVGYAYADWASDAEDRKCVRGGVFGNSVSWTNRKRCSVVVRS